MFEFPEDPKCWHVGPGKMTPCGIFCVGTIYTKRCGCSKNVAGPYCRGAFCPFYVLSNVSEKGSTVELTIEAHVAATGKFPVAFDRGTWVRSLVSTPGAVHRFSCVEILTKCILIALC